MGKIKYIILLALSALIMVGCGLDVEDDTKRCKEYYHTIILDSCEYLSNNTTWDIAHKGNCRFCKERRQKELKELVEQLKRNNYDTRR